MWKKKYTKRVRPVAKKSYKKSAPKSAVSVKALNNKINTLARSMRRNNEMKYCMTVAPLGGSVGQLNANGSGVGCYDLTSTFQLGQGVGALDRIGDSVNAKGLYIRIQLQQQSALSIAVRYKFVIFRTGDFTTALGTLPALCFNSDTISGVIDYNSSRNNVYRKEYQLLKQFEVYCPSDQTASTNLFVNKKLFLKMNQKLEYAGGASTVPQNVRYFIVVLGSAGNLHSSTASTLPNVPLTAISTGATCLIQCNGYYTD